MRGSRGDDGGERQEQDGAEETRRAALNAYAPYRLALWGLNANYVWLLFLSTVPPGPSLPQLVAVGGDEALRTLREALNLSLNFWFILPVTFPGSAPTLHPALEALFNFIVTWGLLCFGFIRDGRRQRVSFFPFLVGTAFLTNVFLVPYLALRDPQLALRPGSGGAEDADDDDDDATRLEAVCESRAFGAVLGVIGALSGAWFCFGRGVEFGGVGERAAALWSMCTQGGAQGDRLAASFAVDACVFWLLQGWLVPDDLRRRGAWQSPPSETSRRLLTIARFVPFFGIAYYLLVRPPYAHNLKDTK